MSIINFINKAYRPITALICIWALIYNYGIRIYLINHHIIAPELNTAELITSSATLLGLGGYRTYEKKYRIAK